MQREGALADSMAVSVLLMQLYIFKFFLCACSPANAAASKMHACNGHVRIRTLQAQASAAQSSLL